MLLQFHATHLDSSHDWHLIVNDQREKSWKLGEKATMRGEWYGGTVETRRDDTQDNQESAQKKEHEQKSNRAQFSNFLVSSQPFTIAANILQYMYFF